MTRFVPKAIADLKQWLCFKAAQRVDRQTGKPLFNADGTPNMTKIPYNPKSGKLGDSTNPNAWSDYETAFQAYQSQGYDGLGIAFANGLMGIDLDHVYDPKTQEILFPEVNELLRMFSGSYIELSPSQTGFHILVFGSMPQDVDKINHKIHFQSSNHGSFVAEMYEAGRYFTFTGNKWPDSAEDVTEQTEQIRKAYFKFWNKPKSKKAPKSQRRTEPQGEGAQLSDEQILELLKDGRYSKTFKKFMSGDLSRYDDDLSKADAALCCMIAYYTTDREQIARIFEQTPLGARNWKDRDDYRDRTISFALESDTAGQFQTRRPNHPDEYTDLRTGRAFLESYGDKTQYCPELDQWLVWDGTRWNTTNKTAIYKLFHEFILTNIEDLTVRISQAFTACTELEEALEPEIQKQIAERKQEGKGQGRPKSVKTLRKEILSENEDYNKAAQEYHRLRAALKDAKRYEYDGRIKGLLNQATGESCLHIHELDANPLKLNTPNGLLDLETGELEEHSPEQLCSKITANTEGRDEQCWNQFLEMVSCGDPYWIEWMQVLCGSVLVGHVYEEGLIVSHGTGGNGKSSFWNAIGKVLGDYTCYFKAEILIEEYKQNRDPEIMKMPGCRFALAPELPGKATFSVSSLKHLFSTDPISARKMYKDGSDFVPTHTGVLLCNHVPQIPEYLRDDDGTLDRLKVVPFVAENLRYTDEEVKDYADTLFQKCGLTILEWMIEGAHIFIERQYKLLPMSDSMIDYQNRELNLSDTVGRFLKDCTTRDMNEKINRTQLYEAYRSFCTENELLIEEPNKFYRQLMKRNYREKILHGRRYFQGIILNPDIRA